jgi:hypothetical protein
MSETPEEKAKRLGVPLIPKRPPVNPWDVTGVCGECGLELRRTMGFVCSKGNCPCGLGPLYTLTA